MNKFFESYKGRWIHHGQLVQIYRNLNKPETTYSIRDKKTGLVLGHATNILLSNCIYVVNQVGRQRVIETRKKQIHAWIEGNFGVIHAGDDDLFSQGHVVKYDPYMDESFIYKENGEPINSSGVVYTNEKGVFSHAAGKPVAFSDP